MIRKSTNLLLTRSFSGCLSSLFRKPSLALLQVIQIIIDTGYLEEATVYLEEFVSNITGFVVHQLSSFSDYWTSKSACFPRANIQSFSHWVLKIENTKLLLLCENMFIYNLNVKTCMWYLKSGIIIIHLPIFEEFNDQSLTSVSSSTFLSGSHHYMPYMG